jgi:glycine cleavage system aminomethyltransferase T
MNPVELVLSRRLRVTPFEARVREQGVKSYTVYNHMVLPVNFSNTQEEYMHLCEHVQLWDVSAERQVEVTGPDALELLELITPRHIAPCQVGQCVYAPLVDEDALLVNDPIVLRLAEDRFWISIADSDVLLWVKGIAWGRGLNVRVFEPDVSPLAVQGPKSDDLMAELVGESVRSLRFFRFMETRIAGTDVVLARSGWSGQGGFEIYLQNSEHGLALWDAVWEAGQKYGIRSGAPNGIERLESGLKSYGSDMTHEDSVLECAFERYLNLDKPVPYMAREAIERELAAGVKRRLCHVMVSDGPLPPLRGLWEIARGDQVVGHASSSAWSPKFEANLLFAMLSQEVSTPGTELTLQIDGNEYPALVKDDRWKS